MGYEHVEFAMESDRYKGVEKAVIVALCKFINNERARKGDTIVWPGMEALIQVAGWSYSAVQRAIDRIVTGDNPAVEIVTVGVGSESTRYRVHLNRLRVGSDPITPQPTVDGGSGEPTEVVAQSLQGGTGERTRYRRRATRVVAESYPNQEYNQEQKSNVMQEEEAVTEAASASSIPQYILPDEGATEEELEDVRRMNAELYEEAITFCIAVAKSYGLNGNCRDEAAKLVPLLVKHQLYADQLQDTLGAAKEDPFMRSRISTWSGLLKMLAKDGLVSQYRPGGTKRPKADAY